MTVYEHRTSLTIASGAATTSTLYIPGGLINQLLIRANTDTTIFRADLKDDTGLIRRHYGFHEGEINDMDINLAITGSYAIEVTNASLNDTVQVVLSVEE